MIDWIGFAPENRRGPDLDAYASHRCAVTGPQHFSPHEKAGAKPVHHGCVRPVVIGASLHSGARSKPGRGDRWGNKAEAERSGEKSRPGNSADCRDQGAT